MLTPTNKCYLLGNVPFDNSYQHVRLFSNASEQFSYLNDFAVVRYGDDSGYSYQPVSIKGDVGSFMIVESAVDELLQAHVNYIMYQNSEHSSRWYFAFVTKINYASEQSSELELETDVFQTWLFDVTLRNSFVMREMLATADDVIGANLIDENLETGDYVFPKQATLSHDSNDLCIALGVTDEIPFEGVTPQKVVGGLYSHVYSGLFYYVFKSDNAGITYLNTALQTYANAGKSDAVVVLFMFPSFMANVGSNGLFYGWNDTPTTVLVNPSISDIDGYVPKNKKLYTYPYNFMACSNQNGQTINYKYEFCSYNGNGNMVFEMQGNISPSPVIRLTPLNYRKCLKSYDDSLFLSGYPLCSWTSDVYSNWLAQNAVSLPLSFVGGLASVATGVASGNVISAGTGVLAVAQEIASIHQHFIQPPEAKGNINGGSSNLATGVQCFRFLPACVQYQYARNIDSYFEMFGYKTNRIKVPNIDTRPYWNYVKCIDVNITGDIPNTDMNRLKQVYNDGVTLWHTNDMLNYGLDNH